MQEEHPMTSNDRPEINLHKCITKELEGCLGCDDGMPDKMHDQSCHSAIVVCWAFKQLYLQILEFPHATSQEIEVNTGLEPEDRVALQIFMHL